MASGARAVFGRALALAYVEGRDDASADDLALRPWKARWPHYVRVRDGAFLASTLADAVSLGELMDALGAEAFWSTQRNALAGSGNVDPRQAYRQQPAVRLSHEGREWLDARLDEAFASTGRLSAAQLARLDWPKKRPGARRRRVVRRQILATDSEITNLRRTRGSRRFCGYPPRLKRPATSAWIWRASGMPIASTAPT